MRQRPVIPPRTSSLQKTSPVVLKLHESEGYSELPILKSTPWEAQRTSLRKGRMRVPLVRGLSTRILEQLPKQVYHHILQQLVACHIRGVMVDAVALLRDLTSLCLVSKRWLHPAREQLYYNIWLLHDDLPRQGRFSLLRRKNRLELLARTLSQERTIAHLVHYLTVTPALDRQLHATKSLFTMTHNTLELLIQLIELCPHLEGVDGFLPKLSPQYAVYFKALLGRPSLRNLIWWTSPGSCFTLDVDRLQAYKGSWTSLQTLVLSQGDHARPLSLGGSVLALLKHMPSLTSLMLAGLSSKDVNDKLLGGLPALHRLRLENLNGITDAGIDRLCEGANAESLQSLTLVGLHIKEMSTITSLLHSCSQLTTLKLIQMYSPVSDSTTVLASASLNYLHWEVLLANESTKRIATSIKQGRLPSLVKIKVPCDTDDRIQALCQPIQEIELTADDRKFMDTGRLHGSSYSIRGAQLRAQLRLQEAKASSSGLNVIDKSQRVRRTEALRTFLGCFDSQIKYCLDPDIPGAESALAQLSAYQRPPLELATMSTLSIEVASFPAYSYDLLF